MKRTQFGLRRILITTLFTVAILIPLGLVVSRSAAQTGNPIQDYDWQTVRLGGGGTVTGIVLHPLIPDLAYIRTADGNAYRWDADTAEWIPLLNWVRQAEWWLGAAESIAVDPNDPNGDNVYAALGKDSSAGPGDIFRSINGGDSWARAGLELQIDASDPGETEHGERLGVDPANSAIIYYASAHDGIWRSTSSGARGSWEQVSPINGNFIIFDRTSGSVPDPDRTRRLYVGNEEDGVFMSQDGGDTWILLPDSPVASNRAAISGTGRLYVTHDEGVALFRRSNDGGTWEDVSPDPGKYVAITLHPDISGLMLVGRWNAPQNETLYLSLNGGSTWARQNLNPVQQLAWTPTDYFAVAPTALAFGRVNAAQVWMADRYYVWYTDNIYSTPFTRWQNLWQGHEGMSVAGALIAPPTDRYPLHSGLVNIGGFDQGDITVPPSLPPIEFRGLTHDTTTGLAYQEEDTTFIVRVGVMADGSGAGAVSTSSGLTYSGFDALDDPDFAATYAGGRVAVAANRELIVWQPQGDVPSIYSTDRGATWTPLENAPTGVISGDTLTAAAQPLAADSVLGEQFYLYHNGVFYRSTRSGTAWLPVSQLPEPEDRNHVTVAPVPGNGGDVWVGLGENGLYRTSDSGSTFEQVPGVDFVRLLAFGAPPPEQEVPAVFVYGIVNGEIGIFRSDDMGEEWFRISDRHQQVSMQPTVMTGDRLIYGRVYIGTAGDGIYYGDPLSIQPGADIVFEPDVAPLDPDGSAVIPTALVPPHIDGVVDDIWRHTGGLPLTNVVLGSVTDEADLSGEIHLMQDFDNLYILVLVNDESLVADSGDLPWQDDAIEVFLDGGYDRSAIYDFNDEQYVFRAGDKFLWTQQGNSLDVEFDVTELEGGYILEARIPWLNVGVFPEDGWRIGIDIHVNDDDAGASRDAKMTWFSVIDDAWRNPSTLGVARLSSEVVGR